MTEGEKLIWAAAYASALSNDLRVGGAVEMATAAVMTLRNNANFIYTKLEKSDNLEAVSMVRTMLDDPAPAQYECKNCGTLVIEPLGEGHVSNLCGDCLQKEWDSHV